VGGFLRQVRTRASVAFRRWREAQGFGVTVSNTGGTDVVNGVHTLKVGERVERWIQDAQAKLKGEEP
jgi:hypothetical protein